VLEVLLRHNGYQTLAAADGAEALVKARLNPPDLVVSDILMPVMDGFTLCREWKKDERLRGIPFVFYTSTYTDERDREFALGLGAAQFLIKPEKPEVLLQTIREVLEQARHPSAPPAPPVAGAQTCPPIAESEAEQVVYLKHYNEALIRKLESKSQQLELTNRELVQDIARRKQAEDELRASEHRYRRLFEAAKHGVLILDAESGVVVDVNPFLAQLLGLPREAFIEKRIWELGFFKAITANQASFAALQRTECFRCDDKPLEAVSGRRIDVEFDSNVDLVNHRKVIQCNLRDITERKRAQEQARIHGEQLRALSARIERLREDERTRISREIHDELGQMLTGIKMDLRWMEHRLDEFGEDRRVNPILDKLLATAELTDATVKTVQRIAAELRPGILDKLGLPMALQYEAAQFEKRTGIACQVVVPNDALVLRPEAATAFFRIFQEALTNVSRHAQATAIEAKFQSEADGCRLEIQDNGNGMAGVDLANPKSLGLLGMQERSTLLGGSVSFAPRPGGGTVVTVWIPNLPAGHGRA
jgi:PAS domain S-box-containing protein